MNGLGMAAWVPECAGFPGPESDLERGKKRPGGSAEGRISGGSGRDADRRDPKAKEAAPEGEEPQSKKGKELPDRLAAVLCAEEHQAEAADADKEAQLEVLPTLEKVVPGPKLLGDGHGEQLDEGETEEKAAEIGANLHAVREGEAPGE
jgi:hypothetical protein